MKQRAYNLMKRWCDKLLTYEIRLPDPNVDSGLICPACHVIHGRFADLVYPLATLWAKTGDRRRQVYFRRGAVHRLHRAQPAPLRRQLPQRPRQ